MTGLTDLTTWTLRSRQRRGLGLALSAGALGVAGLALVLGCPTDVLEGGLGSVLGTLLLAGAPGAVDAPPPAWAGQGVAPWSFGIAS